MDGGHCPLIVRGAGLHKLHCTTDDTDADSTLLWTICCCTTVQLPEVAHVCCCRCASWSS